MPYLIRGHTIFGPLSEGNNEHNRRFGIETRCCGIVLHQLSHNHSLYNIFLYFFSKSNLYNLVFILLRYFFPLN